jgi:glucose/mannose transport system substrate-binding protein
MYRACDGSRVAVDPLSARQAHAYVYNIDSFARFRLKDPQAVAGQKALAATIMSPQFQEIFNRNKGSIP